MPLSIAAWNVNSVNARLPTVLAVLKDLQPDVVCLQELKCEDARFPRTEIEDAGYNVESFGQKTYNGVALLSKYRMDDVTRGVPGFTHEQSRYIEAVIDAPAGPVRVASIYAPNGNPIGTEKYTLKLDFMAALNAHAKALLLNEEKTVLCGDYNVIPREVDCQDSRNWLNDALFQPETRAAYRALQYLGYADAYMQADGRAHQYTFWDYQAGAWQRDNGIRIDHLLLSPQAADKLDSVSIHRAARGMEKASDHVPIVAVLRD